MATITPQSGKLNMLLLLLPLCLGAHTSVPYSKTLRDWRGRDELTRCNDEAYGRFAQQLEGYCRALPDSRDARQCVEMLAASETFYRKPSVGDGYVVANDKWTVRMATQHSPLRTETCVVHGRTMQCAFLIRDKDGKLSNA